MHIYLKIFIYLELQRESAPFAIHQLCAIKERKLQVGGWVGRGGGTAGSSAVVIAAAFLSSS